MSQFKLYCGSARGQCLLSLSTGSAMHSYIYKSTNQAECTSLYCWADEHMKEYRDDDQRSNGSQNSRLRLYHSLSHGSDHVSAQQGGRQRRSYNKSHNFWCISKMTRMPSFPDAQLKMPEVAACRIPLDGGEKWQILNQSLFLQCYTDRESKTSRISVLPSHCNSASRSQGKLL